MWNLIPTELYQYSTVDLVRGIRAAVRRDAAPAPLGRTELREAVPARSARAAIVLSLRAMDLKPGAWIGVPLYCCPVVFKAIVAAGCRPRFLEVDPETFCLSPEHLAAEHAGLDALIAVHMFGHMCDMKAVRSLMGGKPVLEDCAQALGSRLDGQPAGTMGTVGIFSFRLGKYLSAGEGAAIIVADPSLRGRIRRLTEELPRPTAAEEARHVVESWVRAKIRTRPLWGLAGSRIWQTYNRKTDFSHKSPIVMTQMYRSDLEISRLRLLALDGQITTQRRIAEFYIEHLDLDPAILHRESPGVYHSRLMFPLTFDSPEVRNLMRGQLFERGIGATAPYEDVIEGAAANYGYEHDCPVTERLLRRTLVIPCHHRLRQRDIERIVSGVNDAWTGIHRG